MSNPREIAWIAVRRPPPVRTVDLCRTLDTRRLALGVRTRNMADLRWEPQGGHRAGHEDQCHTGRALVPGICPIATATLPLAYPVSSTLSERRTREAGEPFRDNSSRRPRSRQVPARGASSKRTYARLTAPSRRRGHSRRRIRPSVGPQRGNGRTPVLPTQLEYRERLPLRPLQGPATVG